MSDDLSQDIIPVKDGPDLHKKHVSYEVKDDTSQQRRIVFKLPREELEDRYLRLCEENLLLKTHSRKQEDKIKKMATKLVRLINDHKKQEQGGIQQGRRRDVETEELIEEMQDKIRDLDRQNILLKEKLVAAKQQLASHSKRISPCSHRYESTKFGGTGTKQTTTKNVQDYLLVPPSDDVHIYSNEVDFRKMISSLKNELNNAEEEIESLKNQLVDKQAEYEDQLLNLKSQVKQSHRQNVQENVDLIKLQRAMKQSQEKINSMMDQYKKLQDSSFAMKTSHDQLVRELDSLTKQLKEEQSHSLNLQSELQMGMANHLFIAQLKEQNNNLLTENGILRESNAKLLNTAFDVESEQLRHKNESSLKLQISKLEAQLKANIEHNEILHQNLTDTMLERDKIKQTSENSYKNLQEKYDELKEKSEFLLKNEYMDSEDWAEAFSLLQQKRSKIDVIEETSSSSSSTTDSAEKINEKHYKQLQLDRIETINELEKTRIMLQLQCKINDDYKQEIEMVNKKFSQLESELAECLKENTRLLKLQANRDYQLSSRPRTDIGIFDTTITNTVITDRQSNGETLIEICMKNIMFTNDGYRLIGDQCTTLLTWSFYDFEIMSTNLVYGDNPVYNCTAQYSVNLNDAFLHYITNDSLIVEFQRAFGTDFQTIATIQIPLSGIIDSSQGRFSSILPLIGLRNNEAGIMLGKLNFSMGIRTPSLSTLRHFRDKSRSLKSLKINDEKREEFLTPKENLLNELTIRIIQCKGLSSTQKGVKPSVYCVFKFFDWPDHDTTIVPFNNDPYFNDHISYQVVMDEYLHNYLQYNFLRIYAFDDTNLQDNSYMGVATISLTPLTENRPIHDTFKFKRPDGTFNGTIGVTVRWKHSYMNMTSQETPTKTRQIPVPIPRKLKNDVKQTSDLSNISTTNQQQEIDQTKISLTPPKSQVLISGSEELTQNSNESKVENHFETQIDIEKQHTPVFNEFDEDTENSTETDFSDVITPQSSILMNEDKITIEICRLTLFDNTRIIFDDDIRMLFVEYRFLDYPPEELETPYALPKPKPNQSIAFNFHKEFKMNIEENNEKRVLLREMLHTMDPDEQTIKFILVSEPFEDEKDAECEDIAYAFVSLQKILNTNHDLIEEDIPLYDIEETQNQIGTLTVTIEALQVLKSTHHSYDVTS